VAAEEVAIQILLVLEVRVAAQKRLKMYHHQEHQDKETLVELMVVLVVQMVLLEAAAVQEV
jgi:hypothetical protein